MALILGPKEEGWGESYGKALGQLGEGIGSGFQALANMKMQDYAARQAQTRKTEQQKSLNDRFVKMMGPEYDGAGYADPQVQAALVRAWQQKQSGQALSSLLNQDNTQDGGQNNQQPIL